MTTALPAAPMQGAPMPGAPISNVGALVARCCRLYADHLAVTSASKNLSYAALEQRSEHPLARAVMLRAEEDKLSVSEVSDFRALPGNGLTATLNDEELLGGKNSFADDDAQALASGEPLPASQQAALAGAGLLVLNKAEELDAEARARLLAELPSVPLLWTSQGALALCSARHAQAR